MDKEEKELSDHLDIISLTQDLKKQLYYEYRDNSYIDSIAEALSENIEHNRLLPEHNQLPSPILKLVEKILSSNKSFTPEKKKA